MYQQVCVGTEGTAFPALEDASHSACSSMGCGLFDEQQKPGTRTAEDHLGETEFKHAGFYPCAPDATVLLVLAQARPAVPG